MSVPPDSAKGTVVILGVIELHRRVATGHHPARPPVRQTGRVHCVFPVIPPRLAWQQSLPIFEGDAIALVREWTVSANPPQRLLQLLFLRGQVRVTGRVGLSRAAAIKQSIKMPALLKLEQAKDEDQNK